MDVPFEVLSEGSEWCVVALRSGDRCLFWEFYESLRSAPQRQNQVLRRLRRLADHGPPRLQEQGRPIEGETNLHELKPDSQVRLMYFLDVETRRAVVTHGFFKTTGKTPRREIERANKVKSSYFEMRGQI